MELINKQKFLTLVLTLDAWRLPYACDACPSKIEPLIIFSSTTEI